MRNDIGMLWENFLILERMKKTQYHRIRINTYFWRTYTGAELDYLEEANGVLSGFEMKWGKAAKAPASWLSAYDNAQFECITKENFLAFVS